jgi:uncharacterized protein VirK/YbjX
LHTDHDSQRRRALLQLLRHAAHGFGRMRRSDGSRAATASTLAALRGLAHPGRLARLFRLGNYRRLLVSATGGDALFPLSHKHFLLAGLSVEQRIDCAIEHFRHEAERCDEPYQAAVYGGGGVCLWQQTVDDAGFRIELRSTPQSRHEGPVSIVLKVDGMVVHEPSFAWVEGSLLDASLRGRATLLVTRNQSARADLPGMERFRSAFPQNAPSYFCLAALNGLAEAHGLRRVAGIDHRAQISYEPALDLGFRRSYSEFWEHFGSAPLGPQAHLIEVPPRLPPLTSVAGKHRARARARREHWALIATASREALRPMLRTASARPAPRLDPAWAASSTLPGMLQCLIASVIGVL